MVDEATNNLEADLAEFKEIILNKIQKAQLDLDLIKVLMNDLNNGTDDTPQHFKAFEGSETIKQTHNWRFVEKFIRDLKNVPCRKQNVVCKVTGKIERKIENVPHATMSIEARIYSVKTF
jgi:hypothetical protein